MDYYINPQSLSSVFTVPSAVVDKYFKLAKPEHIKVLLFVLRNMTEELENKFIADECGVSDYDVEEALLYWADAGILVPKTEIALPKKNKEPKKLVSKRVLPTRSEIRKMSLTDSKIQYLLVESQLKLGKTLTPTEESVLVWLYKDEGLDVSIILLILQYAVMKDKVNIRFIEKVAANLLEKGIDNVADADAELHKNDLYDKAWLVVCNAFGIEYRKPTKKETEASVKWICEWNLSKEMLEAAYEECVNTKSKFIFAYAQKIIENWHSQGFESPEDIKKKPKNDIKTHDLDLFEKMLNSKD